MQKQHKKLDIKKFYFSIGGFPGPWHSIEYKNGVFAYRTEPKEMADELAYTLPTLPELESKESPFNFLDPSSEDLQLTEKKMCQFYAYIRRYCKHWKRKYSIGEVCDGTSWECDIWIADFRLRSEGLEAYPKNFDPFLRKLTVLTEGKIFE